MNNQMQENKTPLLSTEPYEALDLTQEQFLAMEKLGRERLNLPNKYVERMHVIGTLTRLQDEVKLGNMDAEYALNWAIEKIRAMEGVNP